MSVKDVERIVAEAANRGSGNYPSIEALGQALRDISVSDISQLERLTEGLANFWKDGFDLLMARINELKQSLKQTHESQENGPDERQFNDNSGIPEPPDCGAEKDRALSAKQERSRNPHRRSKP